MNTIERSIDNRIKREQGWLDYWQAEIESHDPAAPQASINDSIEYKEASVVDSLERLMQLQKLKAEFVGTSSVAQSGADDPAPLDHLHLERNRTMAGFETNATRDARCSQVWSRVEK